MDQRIVSQLPAVHVPPISSVEAYVIKLWEEQRELPGGTRATVRAYVVPQSGVGWVDCAWMTPVRGVQPRQLLKISPERRRMLADWTGHDQASIVRQVIVVADGWFAHCTELAEREQAAAALAAAQPPPFGGELSGTYPPSPHAKQAQLTQQMLEQLRRQLEKMREQALPTASTPALFREGQHELEKLAAGEGLLAELPSPDPGHQAVKGVLFPFAGETVLGPTERASDGLSYPTDDVTKPHVGL